MRAHQKHSKEKLVKYIEATLVQGMDEKAAYKLYLNPKISHPSAAVSRLKKTIEYQTVYAMLHGDDKATMERDVKRVKSKYVKLVEKTIDTTSDIFEEVKDEGTAEKAKAVRLATETLTALSFVDQPTPDRPGKIDTSGMVLS